MKTEIYTEDDLSQIVDIIKHEGIVAFPTETVFGLGIRYDSLPAIRKLKSAKQRPETKPFPMMVGSVEQIEQVAVLTERDRLLISRWMPGPITMIFKKKGTVPAEVTNGFETIALRMPDNAFVLSVINGVGVPLLVPSANITTQPPALNYQEVLDQLDGRIDGVVIGTCRNNISSTILNTLEPELTIVREGPISLEAIKMSLKETANG